MTSGKMKKRLSLSALTVSISMVLMVSNAYAVVPSGFVGVPWGATRETVKSVMAEQNAQKKESTGTDALYYRGVFDGMPCTLEFRFLGNAFVEGTANWLGRCRQIRDTKIFYAGTVKRLNEKYGQPQEAGENSDTQYCWTTWSFASDGAVPDTCQIQVVLYADGAWFTDLNDQNYIYYSVTYTAVSLKQRLRNSQL
jgi:hypothetical protein